MENKLVNNSMMNMVNDPVRNEDNSSELSAVLTRIANALERIAGNEAAVVNFRNLFNASFNEVVKASNEVNVEFDEKAEAQKKQRLAKNKYFKELMQSDPLNSVAMLIGKYYDSLKTMLEKLKESLESNQYVNVSFPIAETKELTMSCQLCNMLKDLNLVAYFYNKTNRTISIKAFNKPSLKEFLRRGWLNMYLSISSHRFVYGKEGCTFEENQLFEGVTAEQLPISHVLKKGDEIYWISGEATTSVAGLKAMSDVINKMSDSHIHGVFVYPEIESSNFAIYKEIFGLDVMDLSAFADRFKEETQEA